MKCCIVMTAEKRFMVLAYNESDEFEAPSQYYDSSSYPLLIANPSSTTIKSRYVTYALTLDPRPLDQILADDGLLMIRYQFLNKKKGVSPYFFDVQNVDELLSVLHEYCDPIVVVDDDMESWIRRQYDLLVSCTKVTGFDPFIKSIYGYLNELGYSEVEFE